MNFLYMYKKISLNPNRLHCKSWSTIKYVSECVYVEFPLDIHEIYGDYL